MKEGEMNRKAAAGILITVVLTLGASAWALTVNLGEHSYGKPISLSLSQKEANRIEFPEAVINAFSSNERIDVKIIGSSALVRTEKPAELIVLTEKRRLTLLLSPEDVPSRTIIIRKQGEAERKKPEGTNTALPQERAVTRLVLSLAREVSGKTPGRERNISEGLYLSRLGSSVTEPLLASAYLVENRGASPAALEESMFSRGPETVAVGMESVWLGPGESARVYVVTRKETEK